jgi:hypothetical protein
MHAKNGNNLSTVMNKSCNKKLNFHISSRMVVLLLMLGSLVVGVESQCRYFSRLYDAGTNLSFVETIPYTLSNDPLTIQFWFQLVAPLQPIIELRLKNETIVKYTYDITNY